MSNSSIIIYIVDDDISIRRALTVLLQAHGFKVEAFACAADFLAFKHPRSTS